VIAKKLPIVLMRYRLAESRNRCRIAEGGEQRARKGFFIACHSGCHWTASAKPARRPP
jgi:hypothetical protein